MRAHSDGAKALIDLAAAIAAETRPDQTRLGAPDLFWALLVEGQRQPGAETASRWLHNWIAERTSVSITSIIAPYLDVKRVPVHGFMPLTAHASAVLARARAIASLTVKRTGYDIRHIAAALTLADSAGANENVLGIAQRSFGVDLTGFPQRLTEIISTSRERAESVQAWRNLAIEPVPSPSPKTTPGPAAGRDTVANLNADHVSASGTDPLGVQADVTAFARLICLEHAMSSLSIGLFGEWGSGKSSFMERLQGEIESLTEKERTARKALADAAAAAPAAAKEAEAPAAPRFIENVVQIRFNAWHFADANLWASLTAEFFDQLRAGGSKRQGGALHAKLVERVNTHVHNLTSTLTATREALSQSEKALIEAQKARDAAVKAVGIDENKALSQTLVDAVGGAYEKHKPDLFEIGRRAYQDDVTKGVDDFVNVAKKVQTIGGQIGTVVEIVTARGWRVGLLLMAVAFVALAIAGLTFGDKTAATSFLTQIGFWGWLGALASATGALLPAVSIVAGIMKSTADFAGKLDAVTKDNLKKVLAREAELKQAAAEAKARREAMERAQRALTRYVDPDGAANPPRLLRYILEDDPETKVFDSQIGLISRARRLFQSVDEVVKDERRKRDAGQKGNTAVPDRIVLYIDDLDRCTHEQVYAVLQAIHLLLAFELFVVVVGVDVRWVEEAVARQFASTPEDLPDSASKDEREAARQKTETERRKRAIDYLEKIFQLPFWLRRLSTESTGSAGGTYGAYVRDLLQANLEVPEGAASPLAPLKTLRAGGALTDAAEETGEAAPETEAVADTLVDAEDGFASLGQALATVRLTQAEVDFLASPEIGAIAAKSPRAVKRLINVYRIIRARMSEAELAEFLGENGKPPSWPIAVFLAAVETGQSVEVADALNRSLNLLPETDLFKNERIAPMFDISDSDIPDPDDIEIRLTDKGKLYRRMVDTLAAISQRRGVEPMVMEMLAMARIVRRYSFNRYH
jgi:hypothetical protein